MKWFPWTRRTSRTTKLLAREAEDEQFRDMERRAEQSERRIDATEDYVKYLREKLDDQR